MSELLDARPLRLIRMKERGHITGIAYIRHTEHGAPLRRPRPSFITGRVPAPDGEYERGSEEDV